MGQIGQSVDHAVTVASQSKAAVTVVSASVTGLGISTFLGWMEQGIGFAAALLGLLVSTALLRKLRAEHREAKLRIELLERDLNGD